MTALIRRYTFKLYPNAAQAAALDAQRRLCAALYNALLYQRIDAYERRGLTLSFYDQSKEITLLRAACPEWRALSRSTMDATAERLDRAYQAFFRRLKAVKPGEEAGFPRYKRHDAYPSIPFKRHRDCWRYEPGPDWRNGRLCVRGVPGPIKVRGKLPAAPRAIRTCEILWREDRWWLSLVVAMAPRRHKGDGRARVTFDLITEFARVETIEACDGGPAAGASGPAAAGSERRITAHIQEVATGSVRDAPGSGGDQGEVLVLSLHACVRDAPGSGGDQGSSQIDDVVGQVRDAPGSGGDQGYRARPHRRTAVRDAPGSGGDQGYVDGPAIVKEVRDAPGSGSDQGGRPVPSERRSVRDAPGSGGDQGYEGLAMKRPPVRDAPGSGGDQGLPVATAAKAAVRDAPGSGGDQGDALARGDRHVVRDAPGSGGDDGGRQDEPNENVTGSPLSAAPFQRATPQEEERLKTLQQAMARCTRGSRRYRDRRRRKARLQARLARRHANRLHEWTTALARRFAEIEVVAPASIKDATASAKGTKRNPGAEVEFKADVNRRAREFAPAAAIAMIEYKLAEAGGTATVVAAVPHGLDVAAAVVSTAKSLKRAKRKLRNA